MATPTKKHLELYRLIMTEIKERCEVLQVVAERKANVWPVAAYELGILQIRLICELIGLGCLAAHGDISATYSKRLVATYEPGRIFSELAKLHPNFYPRACTAEGSFTNVGVLDDKDFLSRSDIVALHGRTGNVLHRGRLKDIGRGFHLDFNEIRKSRNKIVDLLRMHMISFYDAHRYAIVIMSDPQTGNVGVAEIKQMFASDGWSAQEALRRGRSEVKR